MTIKIKMACVCYYCSHTITSHNVDSKSFGTLMEYIKSHNKSVHKDDMAFDIKVMKDDD